MGMDSQMLNNRMQSIKIYRLHKLKKLSKSKF